MDRGTPAIQFPAHVVGQAVPVGVNDNVLSPTIFSFSDGKAFKPILLDGYTVHIVLFNLPKSVPYLPIQG